MMLDVILYNQDWFYMFNHPKRRLCYGRNNESRKNVVRKTRKFLLIRKTIRCELILPFQAISGQNVEKINKGINNGDDGLWTGWAGWKCYKSRREMQEKMGLKFLSSPLLPSNFHVLPALSPLHPIYIFAYCL